MRCSKRAISLGEVRKMKDNGNKTEKDRQFQVSINLDTTPVLYTDNINMNINRDGVVLNVLQKLEPSNRARIVARIGMSREHAKKFVEKLGRLLLKSEGEVVTGKKVVN
jgi:hypothetical protein